MKTFFTSIWKFICLNFSPFSACNFNPHPALLFRITTRKMDTKMEELKHLNKRLNTAEAEVKKLLKEIASIRGAMHQIMLKQKSSVMAVPKRQFSTTVVDGVDPNDFLDDLEEAQPPKRAKPTPNDQKFTVEDDHIVVYTDGACENNGKRGAKAGIGVWFGPNHPLNASAPVTGKATNNNGEIQACIKAIEIADEQGVRKLCIRTDSQFVINAMTSWIKKWKKNNWKVSTGGDVKNKEHFVKLDACCKKIESIKWEYVAGHSGNIGNDAADYLARQGALAYVS